jgi:hypothetical protein
VAAAEARRSTREAAAPGDSGIDAGTDAGLSQGLVAYYACDQATGATLPDLSGNNNNATLVTGTGGTGGYQLRDWEGWQCVGIDRRE